MADVNGIKRGHNFKDLTGLVVGRLTVVRVIGVKPRTKWLCKCECGSECEVIAGKLLDKVRPTRSCGCLAREVSAENGMKHATHRMSHGPEYYSWQSMKRRCEDPRTAGFDRYGGRGIIVCDRWRNSFEAFFADIGKRPTISHSLDRIDNDGNYEPGNCRWSTKKEQSRNTRTNRILSYHGKLMRLVELCELSGKSQSTIINRLNRGLTVEDAIDRPVDSRKSRSNNGRV